MESKMTVTEYEIRLDDLMPLFREQLAAGKSVQFSPKGISMLPMLRQEKDSVVLSPVPQKLRKYDLPLYQRDNGKYVLHRVIRAGETYTCMGDNQFEEETGLRHEQMIGLVTAFYRGNRRITVSDPIYWIYCRIWQYSRPARHFWRRGIGWLKRHLQ